MCPFDGVVTARNIDNGQLINSGAATSGTAQELFRVQAVQTLRVYTNLPGVYLRLRAQRGEIIDLTFRRTPRPDLSTAKLVRTSERHRPRQPHPTR